MNRYYYFFFIYRVAEGDIVNLRENYGKKIYAFRVEGVFQYLTCLGIFMTQEYYNQVFEEVIILGNMFEMVKILGYQNRKVAGLYLIAPVWVAQFIKIRHIPMVRS